MRKVLIGFIVAVVIVLAIGVAIVVGAASSLPSGEHPAVDFRNPQISADRAAVVPELEAQLEEVESRFGAERVGPRWRIDRCEAGQDNFTRQDRYAYTCRMAVVQLMPVGDPFAVNAARLGEALLEGDCPDGTDTDRALAEPYHHPRQLDSSTGDCTPGLRYAAPEIRHWLTVRPTADDVEVAKTYLGSRCRPSLREEYCDSDAVDLRAAAAAASPDAAYLAIVVADDSYHSIPWDCPWPASWFRDSCMR